MAHKIPEHLKYTKEHEWIGVDGDIVTVGITDFAQSQLGDIVFVELPQVGAIIEMGTPFGVVESIKSVSDLYMPVSGEICEVNGELPDEPEKINAAPYDSWMIKIKLSRPEDLEALLSSSDYEREIGDGSSP